MGKIIAVTMADIGRAAGVSQTAVSLAFRRDPSIPEDTRKRIFGVARRLGYRPHAAISALMAQVRANKPVSVTAELAAVTFWSDRKSFARHRTWQQQWQGARKRAEQLGYLLEEFWMQAPKMSLRRLKSVLLARNIEGAVLFPLPTAESITFPFEQLSTITIGYTVENPLINRVVTAHFEAVLIALAKLRGRGYTHIGLLLDEQMNQRVRRNWQAAFLAYGHEAGNNSPQAIMTLQPGDQCVQLRRWLRRFKPDAFLCGGQFPIRSWLADLGYRAPEDIGFVGLANLDPGERCAQVDEQWDQVGAAAVDLLVGQMHRRERGIPERPMLTLIRGKWVEGESVRQS